MKLLSIASLIVFTSIQAHSQGAKETSARVERYLKPYVETNNFSGTVLVSKNGEIIFHKAYGLANIELNVPNELNTVYQIASISKTFTAAGILILEQRGLLATTDLLSKYLPDFPSGDKITIHHLLTHTTGITNVNNLEEYNCASQLHQTPETLIALFKAKPLEFQPGEKYQYSNSNYNVLAFIIEKVSGKKYGDFLAENIFTPLKMASTLHHDDDARIILHAASGYAPNEKFGVENAQHLDWSSKTGNGSIATTAEDLLQWDRALYTETILTEKSKTKMFTEYVESGYGWYISKKFDRNCVYMNGRSPGFNSHIGRYPDDNLCVIVLENSYVATATVIGFDLAGISLNQEIEVPDIKLVKASKSETNDVLGKYQFGHDFYRPDFLMTVTEKNGDLFTDWGILIPEKPYHFIQRSYWSKIGFTKDEKGAVTSMTLDKFVGKKVE